HLRNWSIAHPINCSSELPSGQVSGLKCNYIRFQHRDYFEPVKASPLYQVSLIVISFFDYHESVFCQHILFLAPSSKAAKTSSGRHHERSSSIFLQHKVHIDLVIVRDQGAASKTFVGMPTNALR